MTSSRKTHLAMLIIASMGVSSTASAVTCPPIGIVQTLANPALEVALKSPGTAFDAYDEAISLQLKTAFANIQNAVVEQNMQLAQTTLQAAEMLSKNQTEVARLTSELKMNHEAYLEKTAKREKMALLPTGRGGSVASINRDYFANLCAVKKTSDAAFGAQKKSEILSKSREVASAHEFAQKGALTTFTAGQAVTKHYEEFCTETDRENRLCQNVAKIPNADLLAFVFLKPMNEEGKGVVKDVVMKTEYTYSEYEKKAALAYIEHVVPTSTYAAPPMGLEADPNVVSYTSRYNQIQSMKNLARYAYSKAYHNRVPVVDTDSLRLSKLDQIRVLLTKAETTDSEAITNANPKGKMLFVLNQMTLESALEQEIAELEKLNNDLLAGLLAEKNNSPSYISSITSKLR